MITSIAEYCGLHYGIGLIKVVFVGPVLNYLTMKMWTFAPTR
ncbi:hypothetical protein [Pseudomonas syringae]|nr:hypothetical protein [Pseudomonas syringae]